MTDITTTVDSDALARVVEFVAKQERALEADPFLRAALFSLSDAAEVARRRVITEAMQGQPVLFNPDVEA